MSEINPDGVEMLVAIEPNGQARCLVCDQWATNAALLRDHDCDAKMATSKIPIAAQNLMDLVAEENGGAMGDQAGVASDAIDGVLADLGVSR